MPPPLQALESSLTLVLVILGATNPLASAPGTIRGDYAIDVGRNVCHGSDGVESAKKEIALWFKPEEIHSYEQDQKAWIYEACGLDPAWCQQAFLEALTDAGIREELQETTNIFRVLIKTLLKAGIITDRTRGNYAAYIDMAELYAEGDRMVGDDIAEEGIKYLMKLNGGRGLVLPSQIAAE